MYIVSVSGDVLQQPSLTCADDTRLKECGTTLDRDDVQEELSRLNPEWWEYLHDNIRNGVSAGLLLELGRKHC